MSEILKRRVKKGWNQQELADKVGCHRATISRAESGQAIPDARVLYRLSVLFECSMEDLLDPKWKTDDAGNP